MPTDRDIIDDRDQDTFTSIAEVNRLNAALNVQRVVSKRLSALKAGFIEPDVGDRPTAAGSLEAIKTEAATVVRLADELLALIPR
jgi:hypothetical protein